MSSEPTMSETMQKPDLTVCQPGDVGVCKDGERLTFVEFVSTGSFVGEARFRFEDGCCGIFDPKTDGNIIAILRDGVQISPPVSKPVEPVNAGAGCDLGRYRTGETPMVGDVVSAHDDLIQGATYTPCYPVRLGDPLSITAVSGRWVGLNGGLSVHWAARFDLVSRPATPPGQGTEGEDKDARIAELGAENNTNAKAATYWWGKYCESVGIQPIPTTAANLQFIREWKELEAEVTKVASLLLRIRGAIHHTESGFVAIHDDLSTRDTVKAIDDYLNNRPASPAESPEPVEEQLVKQDICPKCRGEMDTGWECNACGFDAKPIADAISPSKGPSRTWLEKMAGDEGCISVGGMAVDIGLYKKPANPSAIPNSSNNPAVPESSPAAPVPAGQVVDGPGRYVFDKRVSWTADVVGKGDDGRWYGDGLEGPDSWDDSGVSQRWEPEGNLTGRYEPKPVTPVLTIEDHLRTLTSFVGHVGRKNIFDGGVVQAASTAVEALVAAVNEKGGV